MRVLKKLGTMTMMTAALTLLATASTARAGLVEVEVRIENLAPMAGTNLTPFWAGFHDGGFDLYDSGAAASAELERLAEDGNTAPISAAFQGSGAGTVDATIGGAPIAPGGVVAQSFMLDGSIAQSRYFSYAAMILPSNDAFIANGDPLAVPIFDADGNFVGADFVILGTDVLDAGTEVNDEIPANTAFFGQMMPDTGVTEGGVVGPHPGYLGSLGNPGTPSILADSMFSNADFTQSGYEIARITITVIPAPAGLAAFGLFGLVGRRRRG
jgi:hypothetical protein